MTLQVTKMWEIANIGNTSDSIRVNFAGNSTEATVITRIRHSKQIEQLSLTAEELFALQEIFETIAEELG